MSNLRSQEVDPRLEPWREPVRGGYPDPALFGLSGIEQLRASLRPGAVRPPLSHLIGTRLTEVDAGRATFTMPASPWLQSPQGAITIGQLAILADAPLGCAVITSLPPSTGFTTAELSLRAVRPVKVGTTLTAKGRLIHGGRTVALSEVAIEDSDGRLVAHGSSLCFIFPPQRTPQPPPASLETRGQLKEERYSTPDPYLRPAAGEVLQQEVWERMSGLEVQSACLAGKLPLPPSRYLTGLRLVEVSEGQATFEMPASEWLCPPTAKVQGGVTAMLADAALAGAIQSITPAGTALAPIDLKVNFLRPAIADGRNLVARGKVAHAGRTIAVAHSEVTNADGKQIALATGTAVLLPGRAASLGNVKVD